MIQDQEGKSTVDSEEKTVFEIYKRLNKINTKQRNILFV
jgi:hypothetical protein